MAIEKLAMVSVTKLGRRNRFVVGGGIRFEGGGLGETNLRPSIPV
jgi:hypothetical protein